ncbi:MAG: hypothetical protein IJ622_08075 [Bacteroidales bacterium]|nr:hypothetical protein [Bacteroidales bacterium]
MKNKILAFTSAVIIAVIAASCSKYPDFYSLIDDKDKIDIKGSLMGGDMRSPNIEAGYLGKTVYVYFHDYMDYCTVTVSNAQDSILFQEETPTYPNAEVRYYMGNLPLGRYHLVISDGTDEAEGWFNNFRIVAVKPH